MAHMAFNLWVWAKKLLIWAKKRSLKVKGLVHI